MFKYLIIILFILIQTINAKNFNKQQWYQYGVNSEIESIEWSNIGVKPSKILLIFKQNNLSPSDIYRWNSLGIKTTNIPKWINVNVRNPEKANKWKIIFSDLKSPNRASYEVTYSRDIFRRNTNRAEQLKDILHISRILSWINAGIRDPEIAKAWLDLGVNRDSAKEFTAKKVTVNDVSNLCLQFGKTKYSTLTPTESFFIKTMLKIGAIQIEEFKKYLPASNATLINFVTKNMPKQTWKKNIEKILNECTEKQCKIVYYNHSKDAIFKIINNTIIYTYLPTKVSHAYMFKNDIPRKYRISPEHIRIIVKPSKKEFTEPNGRIYQSAYDVVIY